MASLRTINLWRDGGRRLATAVAVGNSGSIEEKKARLFLVNLGIDYAALTMEQFANLIEVRKLSKKHGQPYQSAWKKQYEPW